MILTIDCSTETAFVLLADKGIIVAKKESDNQKNHAGFLHIAIKNLFQETGISLGKIDAVAVVSGPGSYTGVRVAMATAKGLCFSLSKPLITISGLELLALSCYNEVRDENALYIPLIDARRMEVFTAVYKSDLKNLLPPTNLILEENSFKNFLDNSVTYFIGNGVTKARNVIIHDNTRFYDKSESPVTAAELGYKDFKAGKTAELLLSEPLYIKPFFEG